MTRTLIIGWQDVALVVGLACVLAASYLTKYWMDIQHEEAQLWYAKYTVRNINAEIDQILEEHEKEQVAQDGKSED